MIVEVIVIDFVSLSVLNTALYDFFRADFPNLVTKKISSLEAN